jgi:hypothetical protein
MIKSDTIIWKESYDEYKALEWPARIMLLHREFVGEDGLPASMQGYQAQTHVIALNRLAKEELGLLEPLGTESQSEMAALKSVLKRTQEQLEELKSMSQPPPAPALDDKTLAVLMEMAKQQTLGSAPPDASPGAASDIPDSAVDKGIVSAILGGEEEM